MVIRTQQVRAAATPQVQKDLAEILQKIHGLDAREAKMGLYVQLKESVHSETKNFLELVRQREREHVYLMEAVISLVEELKSPATDKSHDFSKDTLFYFAAGSYFDGGVQTPEMKSLVDAELKRHHLLEAHHPQHEIYTENECSREDIVEMALDRLSRNAQFGDGVIRLENLKKFLPSFTKGNNEEKQKVFWESSVKYHELVQREFYRMYPEAKLWKQDI